MKTSAILMTAAAAFVSAQYTVGADNTYKCDKPNTSYCIGGDIILRCDVNGTGTPGRCSANLSGYPPAGGLASCYESAQGAGDAACEKNCVVYADPSFTLGPDVCKPSYTSTHVQSTLSTVVSSPTHYNNNTKTITQTHTDHPNPPHPNPTHPNPPHPNPTQPKSDITTKITKTTTIVHPNPTHPGQDVTQTITYIYTQGSANCTSNYQPPHPHPTYNPSPSGKPPGPSGNGTCHECPPNGNGGNGGNGGSGGNGGNGGNGNAGENGGNGGNGSENDNNGGNGGSGSGEATRTPISPTANPTFVPVTAGAGMKTATSLLAFVGFVAAYLL